MVFCVVSHSDARLHELAELLEEKNSLVKRLQAENARLRDSAPTSAVEAEVGAQLSLPCVLHTSTSSPRPISHAVCLISRIAARSTYLTCRRVCIPCQPCHLSVHMYPCLICHVWLSTAAARAHRDAREGAARHPDDHGAEDQGAHRRHRSRGGHRLDVALRGCPQSTASCARGPRAAAAGERVHSRAAELGDGEAACGSCLRASSIVVDDAAVRCSWHRQWGSGCCAAAHPAPEPVHSRHCSW